MFQTIGIVIATPVVCVILAYIVVVLLSEVEIGKMTKTASKTGELVSGVFTVLDRHSNIYLVKIDDGYIAFDAGHKANHVLKELAEINIPPEAVKAVFLTHADFDHTGAVGVFTKADVYFPAKEEPIIKGKTWRTFTKLKLPLPMKLKVDYKTVKDNEVLQYGDTKIECLHTPGHTPGSMCFLINDKYLFTGDTLRLIDGRAEGFIEMFTMDQEENIKSIHNLAKRTSSKNIEYVFTAHFGFSSNYGKVFKGWATA